MKVIEPTHILINQIKNIGDVILALPLFGLIKHHFPKCKLTLLGLDYTQAVSEIAQDIDTHFSYNQLRKLSDKEAIKMVKSHQFSHVIHLANNKWVARICAKSKIPCRLGTSQRWYHWLYCNYTINQGRRNSRLHETELNVDFLQELGVKPLREKRKLFPFIHLTPKVQNLPADVKVMLARKRFKLILHPGSNGHGREWPRAHYLQLVRLLNTGAIDIYLTGSQAEAKRFAGLIDACPEAFNMMGRLTLDQFLFFINQCDGLVASGTGPVHIAAALNKPTLGLFPPRKGISPRRWSPPGLLAETLMHKKSSPCLSCRNSIGCLCMEKIQPEEVANIINRWHQSEQLSTKDAI